jgi:hypothetical protein
MHGFQHLAKVGVARIPSSAPINVQVTAVREAELGPSSLL